MKFTSSDVTGGSIKEEKGKFVMRAAGEADNKTVTIWNQGLTLRELLRLLIQVCQELKPFKLIVIDEREE